MDKVLIIDDDRFTQNLLQKSLFQHYDVRTADDGVSGYQLAHSWLPNVILLDVEMPGKNGYELCDELKQNNATQDIPVLFLSSHSSIRERMLGFEVGGDDFLVKPCSQEILRTKLSKLSEYYHQRQTLKQSISSAEQTALEALTTSFELGKAVRFVESTYGISSYERLGSAITEVMNSFELSACVMFKTRKNNLYYSTSNAVAPLEKEILEKLHDQNRFMDFGCRTQINYPQVSLLIKNMPLEDRPRYGRIKDTVPFLLGAADAKIRVLEAEQALLTQNDQLQKSVVILDKLLTMVSSKMELNKTDISKILDNLSEALSLELHKIGLEQDQEDYVLKQVDEAQVLLQDALSNTSPIKKTLEEIVTLLNHLAEDQRKVIEDNLSSEDDTKVTGLTDDIEIF